jgi:flagellar basal body P-ring formation protein FlgA
MINRFFLAVALLNGDALPAAADMVTALRMIPARALIAVGDLKLTEGDAAGGFAEMAAVAGMEARVALYPGRPIMPGDIGPRAAVERNQIVALHFTRGVLHISADGRAMDRAAAGERVRVMNLTSKNIVSGVVNPDGSIEVGQ